MRLQQAETNDRAIRLYHSHPGLFERGVLPDYWFTLAGRVK